VSGRVVASATIVLVAVSAAACVGTGESPSESVADSTPSASAPPASASVAAELESSDFLVTHFAGTTDAPLGYYEYLPPSYADSGASPLLVFLHGFGENGDGTERDLGLVPATGIPPSSD
jgi:predicted peptidase